MDHHGSTQSWGQHAQRRLLIQDVRQTVIKKKKKKKKDMPVTEILNTCIRQRNKHLLEISSKNKVSIKSYSA